MLITTTGGHKPMRRRQLVTWDPFHELTQGWDKDFLEEGFVPAVDVYQKKEDVIVEMDVPGIEAEKVEVSVENNVLTVSGSREEKKEVNKGDYYRKEVRSGSFCRSVELPTKVKGEEAVADFADGILKVTLPKAEDVKPRKIEVKIKK